MAGYVEGQNVASEYRFADNQYDRLPALAANEASAFCNRGIAKLKIKDARGNDDIAKVGK